jgi:hypothetical protein
MSDEPELAATEGGQVAERTARRGADLSDGQATRSLWRPNWVIWVR